MAFIEKRTTSKISGSSGGGCGEGGSDGAEERRDDYQCLDCAPLRE